MSFINISISSGIDPISRQPLIDPINTLPIDVVRLIFQKLKKDLPSAALVCKNWKVLADDKIFLRMIRPIQAFGTQEWRDYIGVDVEEEEPRLPRCIYGDIEKWESLLTFIPEKVKVIENGKEVFLNGLEAIGNLVKKPRTDLDTGYSRSTWIPKILEKRIPEKPHWVWIKIEALGRNKTYKRQEILASHERWRKSGAKIAGLMDAAISMLMEYARSRKRNFIWDEENLHYTIVRTSEKAEIGRICLGFASTGLRIQDLSEHDYCNVGFACAWQSFAT